MSLSHDTDLFLTRNDRRERPRSADSILACHAHSGNTASARSKCERTIADYPRVATALYSRKPATEERARVQRAYEDAWRARVADHSAELWVLDEAAFAAAWKIKPRLREEWPAETVLHGTRPLLLRTFHLPDPPDVERRTDHARRG